MSEIGQGWDDREAYMRLRTAVRTIVPYSKEICFQDLINSLAKSVASFTVRRGYKNAEVVGISAQNFDYGNKFGISAEVKVEKDPNASLIHALASYYKSLVDEQTNEIKELRSIIDKSRTIASARKKLRGMAK